MKMRYIMMVVAVITILFIYGCKTEDLTGSIVDELPGEEASENVEEDLSTEDVEETESDEEVIEEDEEAAEEESTEEEFVEEGTEESAEEETETNEIIIDNFQGTPENLNIITGNTIKWTSQQKNFIHRIGLMKKNPDGTKRKIIQKEMNIVAGESCEYAFEEAGEYVWYSATNYPNTMGTIVVS